MTESAPPVVTRPSGRHARATERPLRCNARKAEDGRLCRRNAGAGTEHRGEGPCSNHDDGTWRKLPFASNPQAQEAFLAAVRAATTAGEAKGTRELIRPLGYVKRDVTELAQADEEFRDRFVEARGFDPETIRAELLKRAVKGGSDPLLKFVAEMNLPEAGVLRQRHTRLDGQIDVRPVYADFSSLSMEGIRPERAAQIAACRNEFELTRLVMGWIAPAQEELPRQGRSPLELVDRGAA